MILHKKAFIFSSIGLVVFALLASLVISGLTKGFDQSVLLWINQHASPLLNKVFVSFTQLGGVIAVAIVTLALIINNLLKRKYTKAIFVAVSIGGVALINVILKTIFDRPRPDLWEWIITETSFSFPSGHASGSFALAITIVLLCWHTKWRTPVTVLAGLYVIIIGLSRMYLGVHFPTDILGGWLVAFTWVSFVAGLLLYIRTRRNKNLKEA
jgi:membrane-associated phospholipid phosphatase